jgi:hypothetical protein
VNLGSVISDIILIPRRFNDLGNVSVYSLLKKSGYFEAHDQISEDAIHQAILDHPECLDDWVQYSEDKRTTGWYIQNRQDGTYAIGYIPPTGKENLTPINYRDKTSACAAFIKREIESIRKN